MLFYAIVKSSQSSCVAILGTPILGTHCVKQFFLLHFPHTHQLLQILFCHITKSHEARNGSTTHLRSINISPCSLRLQCTGNACYKPFGRVIIYQTMQITITILPLTCPTEIVIVWQNARKMIYVHTLFLTLHSGA